MIQALRSEGRDCGHGTETYTDDRSDLVLGPLPAVLMVSPWPTALFSPWFKASPLTLPPLSLACSDRALAFDEASAQSNRCSTVMGSMTRSYCGTNTGRAAGRRSARSGSRSSEVVAVRHRSTWCSSTIRIARSRISSGAYLLGLPTIPILSSNGIFGKPGAIRTSVLE